MLGGTQAAREFLRLARTLDDRGRLPAALVAVRRRAASLPAEPARRWTWLANYLASFAYPQPLGDA